MTNLDWRYATKQFDTDVKIIDKDIQELVEAVRLAPSSYGLQPYKILIISDQETKAKLREVSFGQAQISDCSHLMVFCVDTDLSTAHVDSYMDLLCQTRGIAPEKMVGYKEHIKGFMTSMTLPDRQLWAMRQAYLGLGFLLYACADKKIDACPMEGFVAAEYDKILNLSAQHLTASVAAAIGFRSKDDSSQHAAKVRKSVDTFAAYI